MIGPAHRHNSVGYDGFFMRHPHLGVRGISGRGHA